MKVLSRSFQQGTISEFCEYRCLTMSKLENFTTNNATSCPCPGVRTISAALITDHAVVTSPVAASSIPLSNPSHNGSICNFIRPPVCRTANSSRYRIQLFPNVDLHVAFVFAELFSKLHMRCSSSYPSICVGRFTRVTRCGDMWGHGDNNKTETAHHVL